MLSNCFHSTINATITICPAAGYYFCPKTRSKGSQLIMVNNLFTQWWPWETAIVGVLNINHCPCHDPDHFHIRMCRNYLYKVSALPIWTLKTNTPLRTSPLSSNKEDNGEKNTLVWVIGEMFSATENASTILLQPFPQPKMSNYVPGDIIYCTNQVTETTD